MFSTLPSFLLHPKIEMHLLFLRWSCFALLKCLPVSRTPFSAQFKCHSCASVLVTSGAQTSKEKAMIATAAFISASLLFATLFSYFLLIVLARKNPSASVTYFIIACLNCICLSVIFGNNSDFCPRRRSMSLVGLSHRTLYLLTSIQLNLFNSETNTAFFDVEQHTTPPQKIRTQSSLSPSNSSTLA